MTYVAYLSHPIGPADHYENMVERHDNIGNANAWLRFLIDHTKWAIMCPWLAYISALGYDRYGSRALTDQIMLLERCDLLVQVGGWISPHMLIELNHAKRCGLQIINLTDLGLKPVQTMHIASVIHGRSEESEGTRPRRVWLPPLQKADVVALRATLIGLHLDPYSRAACDVIQRIVTAAMKPSGVKR